MPASDGIPGSRQENRRCHRGLAHSLPPRSSTAARPCPATRTILSSTTAVGREPSWSPTVRGPRLPPTSKRPGQREYPVAPLGVVAAGRLETKQSPSDDPLSIAAGIHKAHCVPDSIVTRAAERLLAGQPLVLTGEAGESVYITFDFYRPVHGFPFLQLTDASAGVAVDFGYAEIARSIYSGAIHVDQTGWLNPEGVVGSGYADRYVTRSGRQQIEMPDERTARWFTLHVHFPGDGQMTIQHVGFVKSQYPIRMVGSFACGDPRVDQIVDLCLTHAEITMSDTYVDTPGREDGQWIEDARPRALLASRWFGDIDLLHFMIRTLAQGQFPDGNLHPFAPSNFPVGGATYDWSVQWVAMLYDDYMWTGSTDRIRTWWPNLVKYWGKVLSCVDNTGLWRTNHILADIRVGLHPENPPTVQRHRHTVDHRAPALVRTNGSSRRPGRSSRAVGRDGG